MLVIPQAASGRITSMLQMKDGVPRRSGGSPATQDQARHPAVMLRHDWTEKASLGLPRSRPVPPAGGGAGQAGDPERLPPRPGGEDEPRR